ncbi:MULTISPECIES: hypothetical protein [unclassified Methylobacterium]|uniref:hypothetical protein n=1 Tax=unclassified Methylobacterium TaxID=2615210 RepID=UPI000700C474|nr:MULTISPECIES: hypothetical protein [unclassified Methylobacterium]KQP85377.1 hypothetical protein ASF60_21710 [Methylobacterium sp. Leaf113]MCK2057070.1 hypothetical protein [Methylobacterium sp. 37f]
MTLKLQPVQIATGSNDRESRLVFEDGLLVAVLVQLSSEHDSHAGHWFLEAGFGRVEDPHAPIFADLREAQAWIARQLADVDPSY